MNNRILGPTNNVLISNTTGVDEKSEVDKRNEEKKVFGFRIVVVFDKRQENWIRKYPQRERRT